MSEAESTNPKSYNISNAVVAGVGSMIGGEVIARVANAVVPINYMGKSLVATTATMVIFWGLQGKELKKFFSEDKPIPKNDVNNVVKDQQKVLGQDEDVRRLRG